MKTKFTSLSLSEQDKSKTVKFKTDRKSGTTVCRLYDRWSDRYFVGVTRCHDVDTFDEKVGRTIAFNKARRKELLTNIAELERDRMYLTEWYEHAMNTIDKRQGLKQIYLAGVEEELREHFGAKTPEDDANEEPVEDLPVNDLQPTEKIKLTQFAKIKTA